MSRHTVMEILYPERQINGNNAGRVTRRLAKGDMPLLVAEDIRSRVGPCPAGKVTYRAFGLEGRNLRARTTTSIEWGKPATAEALRQSGLARKEPSAGRGGQGDPAQDPLRPLRRGSG